MYEFAEADEVSDKRFDVDVKELLELLKSAGDFGGRFLEGAFSSPWTGVPLLMMAISLVDNGNLAPRNANGGLQPGYWTLKFLNSLDAFLGRLGIAAGDALAKFGTGVVHELIPPPGPPPFNNPGPGPSGTIVNFVTSHPIIDGPFGDFRDNSLFGAQFRADVALGRQLLLASTVPGYANLYKPIIETGADNQIYVTNNLIGCSTDNNGNPIQGCKLA